jgi:hypothetical protein
MNRIAIVTLAAGIAGFAAIASVQQPAPPTTTALRDLGNPS